MLNNGLLNAISKMILKFQKYNVNEQIRISKSIISWINNYSKTGFSDEDNLKVNLKVKQFKSKTNNIC